MHSINNCIVCYLSGDESPQQRQWLHKFAEQHTLLCYTTPPPTNTLLLHYNAQGALSIATHDDLAHPFFIDLTSYLPYLHNNRLLRASKLTNQSNRWCVCDATAGLGKDGFVLHQHATSSLWIEHNPVVHALLADALMQAQDRADIQTKVCNLELVCADSIDYLHSSDMFDVIYLDPMFTSNKRRAKKPLQFLRALHQNEQTQDTQALLIQALAKARKKVIVKRHKNDPPIFPERQPNHSNCAKNLCFDIYITS